MLLSQHTPLHVVAVALLALQVGLACGNLTPILPPLSASRRGPWTDAQD